MVRTVTIKKHRYVMSMVSEFVSACYCAETSYAVGAQYLELAVSLNLTDKADVWDPNRLPYQVKLRKFCQRFFQ